MSDNNSDLRQGLDKKQVESIIEESIRAEKNKKFEQMDAQIDQLSKDAKATGDAIRITVNGLGTGAAIMAREAGKALIGPGPAAIIGQAINGISAPPAQGGAIPQQEKQNER